MSVARSTDRSGPPNRSACRALALAALAGALSLALILVPPYAPSGGAVSAAPAPLVLLPRAFVPLVMSAEIPEPPSLTIYDFDGVERDWDWLIATFGAVSLDRGTGSASVRQLRAIEGPSSLVILIDRTNGDPIEGVPVIFYWPDAPLLPPEQQACGLDRGLVIPTNEKGTAEFSMGGGAYYFPPDGGPHIVWVATEGTDCLRGMGMLGGTNHSHLDSVWRVP